MQSFALKIFTESLLCTSEILSLWSLDSNDKRNKQYSSQCWQIKSALNKIIRRVE